MTVFPVKLLLLHNIILRCRQLISTTFSNKTKSNDIRNELRDKSLCPIEGSVNYNDNKNRQDPLYF